MASQAGAVVASLTGIAAEMINASTEQANGAAEAEPSRGFINELVKLLRRREKVRQ